MMHPSLWNHEFSAQWRSDMTKIAKNRICLWYGERAEDAARLYADTFLGYLVSWVDEALLYCKRGGHLS
jgi:hypothetical protein